MDNLVLETIKARRSVIHFGRTPVEEEKIQMILDAGRWSPSWLNTQPWRFLRITNQDTKNHIAEIVPTIYGAGVSEAPICIAVFVDINDDPFHFVEDGAAATQNMALAASSLDLGSCWIGVYDRDIKKDSAEQKIRAILNAPKNYRLISIMPIGVTNRAPEKTRKDLSQLVFKEKF